MTVKTTIASLAVATSLVFPASAFAWGTPKLSLKCDEGTGEAVLTYENPSFTGDVDLKLWQNGTPVADKRVNGHSGELRYKMQPGEYDIDGRATNHVAQNEVVETTEKMHCGKSEAPPAATPSIPTTPNPAPAVLPPAPPVAPVTTCTPCARAERKRERAEKRRRAARQRKRERRMERRARHRATSHRPPRSTG